MRLVICFAYKYEPDWLIDDLRANIAGIADDTFEFNTRDRDEMWIPRDVFIETLKKGARERDADYMLVIAPDERLERQAGATIRRLVELGQRASYSFALREMYTPDSYRVDGVWGQKRRRRLRYMRGKSFEQRIDLNIYHLKHIEPANRVTRAKVLNLAHKVDTTTRGFDYLMDETGMKLERIPQGREFEPPYTRPYIFEVPAIEKAV